MTWGTPSVQKKLEAEGYNCYCDTVGFRSEEEALAKAEEYRSRGYNARALECTTRVKGLHDYCVYIKKIRREV